jgi:hypothetical protein
VIVVVNVKNSNNNAVYGKGSKGLKFTKYDAADEVLASEW